MGYSPGNLVWGIYIVGGSVWGGYRTSPSQKLQRGVPPIKWQGGFYLAKTCCKKKLEQKKVCGLGERTSTATDTEQSQAQAERGRQPASEADMYIYKILNGFKYIYEEPIYL